MRAAPLVAVVVAGGPVVDAPPAGAVVTAAAQLGVQRVEDLGIDLADRQVPDQRPDVLAHQALVEPQRVRSAVELREVALQQLGHGRPGPRVPALSDLGDEPGPRRVRLALGVPARRDQLGQVVPPPGDRIDAGVHADPQRAAGLLLDAALRSSVRRHGATVLTSSHQI